MDECTYKHIRRPLKGSERRVRLDVPPVVPHLGIKLQFLNLRGGVKIVAATKLGGRCPPRTPPEYPGGAYAPPDPPLHGFAKESDCEFHGDNVISREGQHVSTGLNRCWHFEILKPQKRAFYHKSFFTKEPHKLAC